MDGRGATRRAPAAILLGVCLIYWSGIFLATHVPLRPLPGGGQGRSLDKVGHAAAFAGLAVILCATGAMWIRVPVRLYAGVFGAIAAYGALDELTQLFVPGRSADFRDWSADLAGAAFGILVFALARAAWARRR
jgi:hypothetical protein